MQTLTLTNTVIKKTSLPFSLIANPPPLMMSITLPANDASKHHCAPSHSSTPHLRLLQSPNSILLRSAEAACPMNPSAESDYVRGYNQVPRVSSVRNECWAKNVDL